jgi:hypothetical protein
MRYMWQQTISVGVLAVVLALTGCGSRQSPRSPVPRTRHTSDAGFGPATVPDTPASRSAGMPSHDDDDEPHAAMSQVAAARSVAKAFFSSYIACLYGRLPARDVTGADRSLRWQLEHGHATTTPAERASHPRLAHLSLVSAGPPVSVVATVVVTVDHGQSVRLTATLEPHRRAWLVAAVAG